MTTTADIRKYYDDHAHLLLTKTPRHEIIFRQLKPIVRPGMNVLDLGCGAGITTKYMAELGAGVVGVDLSPENIRLAQKHNYHINITFGVCDITEDNFLNNSDAKYDLITLVDCIEHIPRTKRIKLFQNIERYSKPDTLVMINMPDYRFQTFLDKQDVQGRQIVDEAIEAQTVINQFSKIGYSLQRFECYGVDVPCCQYNTLIFWRSGCVEGIFKEALNARLSGTT